MKNNRRYSLLFVIILFAALPATTAYLRYHITKDPTLRPLGLDYEELVAEDSPSISASVRVNVDWGQDRTGGSTQKEMRTFISHIMSGHTDDYVLKFTNVPGDKIAVTLSVGRNRYGPFAPSQLAEGLHLALVALEMATKAKG